MPREKGQVSQKKSVRNKKTTNSKGSNLFDRKKIILALIVIAIGLFIASAVFIGFNSDDSSNKSNASVPTDTCEASDEIIFSCYRKLLDEIVMDQEPAKAMDLVKQQAPKIAYVQAQCHQLTHVIGRAAYDKYQDLGKTFVFGDHYCASGYFHGAAEQIVEKKGAEYIIKNANKVCALFSEKERYSLNHYNCMHGLGHGFLGALDEDLAKSLGGCDALNDLWEQQSCYSGVFMQNIMMAEGADAIAPHTSKNTKPNEPMYPCTVVAEKYKSGCYVIQSSYALAVGGYDYSKVFKDCDATPEVQFRAICYQSVGRDASGMNGYNVQRTVELCNLGKDFNAKNNCFIGAAKDFVYNYHNDQKGYAVCDSLAVELKTSCSLAVKEFYKSFIN